METGIKSVSFIYKHCGQAVNAAHVNLGRTVAISIKLYGYFLNCPLTTQKHLRFQFSPINLEESPEENKAPSSL